MELWIRSQDRESIFKVKNVFYSTDKENEHLIRTIIIDDLRNGIVKLGQYFTKERALEVLDEIQNILNPKYILDTSSIKPDGNFYEENGVIFQKYNTNVEIKELSTFVYQMPEE